MKKDKFPFIAVILGCVLTLIVFKGSGLRDDGKTLIPLLTLLLVSEFGAIVTAIGFYLGGRHFVATKTVSANTVATILCGGLFVLFVVRGFLLWPR